MADDPPITGCRVVGPLREGAQPGDIIDCPCGARIDMRMLGQVLAHEYDCPIFGSASR